MLLSCCLAYHGLPLPRRVPALLASAEALPRVAELLPLLHAHRRRLDPAAPPHAVALQLGLGGAA